MRGRNFAIGMTAVSLAVLLGGGASAASACRKVNGKLTLQAVTDPCPSPVGICARGTYTGDLSGTFVFTGSSLVQTVDTPTTSVVLLTGDNRITTKNGTLNMKDALVLQTGGDGDFAEVETIIGGEGAWAGVTGDIRAHGTFTPAAGGAGEYSGTVCRP